MSDYNPILMKQIYKSRLQDILDYMVISKQASKIEEYKSSKNIIPV